MQRRLKVRVLGIGILGGALVLTVSETGGAAPAAAEAPLVAAAADDPTVLIASPPIATNPAHPPLTVVQNLGTGAITVTNPGGTAPTAQQCGQTVVNLSFCLGTSDKLVYPEDSDLGPISITNAPFQEGGLPGSDLDFLVDEAVSSIAQIQGVRADDLVRTYARPQIRAYVAMRINDILNKKLYGVPMTMQETKAYDALEGIYKTRLVNKAKGALREYDRWSAAACQYDVPDPQPGLPNVPNEVASTQACSALGGHNQLFKIVNGTPSVETFDAWAAYRNPSPLTVHGQDPTVVEMLANTMDSNVTLGSLGAAIAVAGVTAATITTLNLALISIWIADASYHAITWTLAAGGALAIAAAIIIAALVAAVAIWKIVEDAKPGIEIRRRVTEALANDDPFGIKARQADYAGLDYSTMEEPDGQEPALIHEDEFTKQVETNTYEWLMFDGEGDLVADPFVGWNSAGATEPDDLKFVDENDVAYDPLIVLAPQGTKDANGRAISGYRVKVSRGWLLVGTRYTDAPGFEPYEPRLNLRYDAGNGRVAMMSLWRNMVDGEPEQTKFLSTYVDNGGSLVPVTSDSWTVRTIGNVERTVWLKPSEPVLPEVSVVPSVQGTMIADNLVELQSNLSGPGQGTGGTYTWTIHRLDESGAVAETIAPPAGNLSGFQTRLETPGRYRAMVKYNYSSPTPLEASGRIEFTILPPQPELLTASIKDERVLDGKLSLDLRMLQNTHSDTFDVTVEWADDGLGNKVVKKYTVACEAAGSDTCDTGPLLTPAELPMNPNWSESPSYRIPDGQDYLPQITVTIANSYGNEFTRVFPITGDHRPQYATMTPYAEMPAGRTSRVDVVEVFPSPLLTESQDLTIQPYLAGMLDQLPEGLRPEIEERGGRWFLQLVGTPQADAIGAYTFYFPFEQEPQGKALRPAPALATVEVKAATEPGYRSVLLGTTTPFLDRNYRNKYPAFDVQVTQVLADEDDEYEDFTGTVKCRLTAGPTVLFDKVCEPDEPFPWPTERISDTMEASTYVESGTQPISADGPYAVDLTTRFLSPAIRELPARPAAKKAQFRMSLRDGLNTPVFPPFAPKGYTIRCSRDSGRFTACFDDARLSLPRVPGRHTLDVRVRASDNAVKTVRESWRVATPETTFKVNVPAQAKKRGANLKVKASHLLPRERFVVRIDGVKVASGKASLQGTVSKRATVPRAADPGKVAVTVRGANAKRVGQHTLRVLA